MMSVTSPASASRSAIGALPKSIAPCSFRNLFINSWSSAFIFTARCDGCGGSISGSVRLVLLRRDWHPGGEVGRVHWREGPSPFTNQYCAPMSCWAKAGRFSDGVTLTVPKNSNTVARRYLVSRTSRPPWLEEKLSRLATGLVG